MNSPFKFLRRVRIHGGECGAVARALHHEVKGLSLYQADYEKASLSTIERKQMSTKTTLKRIALVAVSALGFGLVAAVAPANAVGRAPTAISVGTIPSAAVGTLHQTPITITAAYEAQTDTHTVTVRITSAPAGSLYAGIRGAGIAADGTPCDGTTETWITANCYKSGSTVAADIDIASISTAEANGVVSGLVSGVTRPEVSALLTHSSWVTPDTTSKVNVGFIPDVPGTYTILVSTSATQTLGAGNAYAAGDANATYTVSTGAAPTSATLATVTGATVTGATVTIGRLMKVTLNSGAVLGSGETFALTTNNTSATMAAITDQTAGTTGSYATTLTLDSSHFVNGVAYFKLADTTATASTTVVTVKGSGLLSPSITTTVSSTTVLLAAASAVTINNGVSAVRPGSGHVGLASNNCTSCTDTAATTATSHSYGTTATTAAATAAVNRMVVTDTDGAITGIPALTYETTVSAAAGTSTTALGSLSITATLAAAEAFLVAIKNSGSTADLATLTVTGAAATLTGTTGSCSAEPAATIRATHGASVVATVLCKDQFGAAFANSALTVSVTGRNATTVSASLATDATGRASYTLADTGTAASSNTQSVIAFNTALDADTTVTVNYGADAVSAVALTTPTSLDTAASGVTYSDINASSSTGTQATLATITATVTDVNGAVIVGVPVTFSTASEGTAILSTTVTVYTGTDGKAAASVYGWTAGVKTYTATAGAVSKTGTVAFRQGGATGTNSPTEVRTIAAVTSGNTVTVTAKDRFGNVVQGVPLWATRTGDGLFGGGNNTAGKITDVNGVAEFIFNAGSTASVVTIQAGGDGSTTAPTDACYGQTGAKAGIVVCSTATTQTAFAANVAGTTTTAETGVGASLSPAGINSVTVNVAAAGKTGAQLSAEAATAAAEAATDAAAEAIDAANAATDAANLAAEAADAATVAAEEARDAADAATAAVEELATQVATLMAALKAQITTLANTVAKIAKKVKA